MKRRKDNKGRVLKEGESQRKDGRYQYRWTDRRGERHILYAMDLKTLRDKEDEVEEMRRSGINVLSANMTVFQGKCSFVWEYGIRVLPISLFPMVSRVIIMEMERLRNLLQKQFSVM